MGAPHAPKFNFRALSQGMSQNASKAKPTRVPQGCACVSELPTLVPQRHHEIHSWMGESSKSPNAILAFFS